MAARTGAGTYNILAGYSGDLYIQDVTTTKNAESSVRFVNVLRCSRFRRSGAHRTLEINVMAKKKKKKKWSTVDGTATRDVLFRGASSCRRNVGGRQLRRSPPWCTMCIVGHHIASQALETPPGTVLT